MSMTNIATRGGTGLRRAAGPVVARMESHSREGTVYEIRQSGDRTHLYCNCPAWRFQRLPPRERTCKHIQSFEANGPMLPGLDTPKALRG